LIVDQHDAIPDDVPADLRDPKTPDEVVIRLNAPEPRTDPTLDVPLPASPAPQPRPKHRLVTLGDSLTHGFQSFAIFNTDISYPAIIAARLGWYPSFRHPEYRRFGGLPLNLEFLVRELEGRFGVEVPWWEAAAAAFFLWHTVDQVREYWETGAGSQVPQVGGIMHNLAVAGYDVRDLMARTADTERARMAARPGGFHLVAADAGPLMGRYVLESARDRAGVALTPVQAAKALADDGGIETLIVFIGANNALGAMTELKVVWSEDGYADLDRKGTYTVWRPSHFRSEMQALMEEIGTVKAQHVIWATVPHVTIVPLAHGLGPKMAPGSRYFPYYTRPWIAQDKFDAKVDPWISGNEARAIDSAIDMYNDAIADGVAAARNTGKMDWRLLDLCGLMDRLASRRYVLDVAARPWWWTPYPLPPALAALDPTPDSLFFAAGQEGRTAGGLFSLDGVHPTTIAYGLIAQEFMNVMAGAGVQFAGQGQVDFVKLAALDTLISDPPKAITADLGWAAALNEKLDWALRLRQLFTSA
jgi:hypothetical protein